VIMSGRQRCLLLDDVNSGRFAIARCYFMGISPCMIMHAIVARSIDHEMKECEHMKCFSKSSRHGSYLNLLLAKGRPTLESEFHK